MAIKFFISLVATILFMYLFNLYVVLDSIEYLLYIIALQLFAVNVICYLYKLNFFSKLFLVLFSAVFSIAIIESSFRLIDSSKTSGPYAYWGKKSDYPVSEANVSYYQTSWLGAQANPGKYRAHKIHPNTTTIYDISYLIGSDRFRVTPVVDLVKTTRINFFGGSFVFGEGVNNNETLPSYFNKLNKDYSVKNYGSHMFGVHEPLAILESDMDTEGDINFLLTAPWHADRLECIRGESAANKPTYSLNNELIVKKKGTCRDFENSPAPPLPSKYDILFQNSFIVEKLKYLFRDEISQESAIDLYIAIISKIHKISEIRGQEFILGFMKADENYFYSSYNNDLIISKLKNLGIKVVDMTLANKQNKVPEKYVIDPKFERHPSAIANYERASILTYFLSKKISN